MKAVPKLPPRSRVEAIFIVLPKAGAAVPRGPHPDLNGKLHIIEPAFDESDWDMLK